MNDHFKVVCPRCDTTWNQCRCPAKDKVVRHALCPKCATNNLPRKMEVIFLIDTGCDKPILIPHLMREMKLPENEVTTLLNEMLQEGLLTERTGWVKVSAKGDDLWKNTPWKNPWG